MKLRLLPIGISIFALSSRALAQGEAPATHDTIRFTYAAGDECPTKSEFAGLVKERGVVIPEDDAAPRALSVVMNPDSAHPEKWRGSLQIKDGTYLGSEKSAAGATCADVAHSLAIFTAIALTPVPASQPSAPATGAASTTSASPTSETVSAMPLAAPSNDQPKDTYTEPDFENAPTLHRHRFALSADGMLIFPLAQPSTAYGVGLSSRYYFSERWGLKLDADFIRSENHPQETVNSLATNDTVTTYYKPVDEIGGKGILSAEFVLNRAVGTLAQGHIDLRNIPADLLLDAGIGAVWTRPLSFNDPTFRTFSYQANLAVEIGLGARVFITRTLAINFGTTLTIYNAHQENTVVASTEAERADQTTWFGPSAIQFDVTSHAAFEAFF
jgi:hypothetical protein